MTYNPRTLQDLGAYWTGQGGVNLGVVGDVNHTVGYHLGRDRIYGPMGQGDDDYSVQQARDRAGLSSAASAIDLGRLNGSYDELYAFSRWLVRTSEVGGDIREIIYSPDGEKVQRWSGVDGKIHTGPGNGDASHRTHTHISYFRDSEQRSKIEAFSGYWESDDVGPDYYMLGSADGVATIKPDRGLVNLVTGGDIVPDQDARNMRTFARASLREPFGGGGDERRKGYVVNYGPKGEAVSHLLLDDVLELYTPTTPGDPPPATSLDVLTGNDGSVYRKQ